MKKPRTAVELRGIAASPAVLVIGAIVLVVIGLSAGYFSYKLWNNVNAPNTNVVIANVNATPNTNATVAIENANTNTSANLNTNATANTNASTNTNVNVPASQSPEIQWTEPTETPSLKVFLPPVKNGFDREQEAKYYKVGTFVSGKYKDGALVLVSAIPEGPAFFPNHYRFIQQSSKITLLQKHSDTVGQYDYFNTKKFSVDTTTTIAALEYPDTLTGSLPRQTLIVADQYLRGMFDPANLKLAFTDPTYGHVYTTDKPSKPEYRVLNSRYGFYLKAPDGTVRVYKLDVDFIGDDKIPNITWSDGKKNDQVFSISSLGGCGALDYADVVDVYLNRTTDLAAVGTSSKGDPVYALKDKNYWMLRDLYNTAKPTWDYNPELKKLTYGQFVAANPLVFFVDPFDRLIKMINMKYGPQVECGKPVIYLYPEKTTKVQVKLEPQGGFSYTEPEYGNGWTVLARPDGTLKNLADGKTYPYLFWEGRGGTYVEPDRGFVVAQSDVHSFLKDSLAKLGLNAKESEDFIEFWEPRMQGSPWYKVSFYGTSIMNQLAPLTILPQPDTIIRILMDYRPLPQPIKLKSQRLSAIPRTGFTVIEWGGVLQ